MKKFLLAATAIAPLSLAAVADAQTVNYSDLQDLFGEPVTTSATGKPQRKSEAPASMIIVTGDEIRQSGARTIPDILQNYAGIDVNRYATTQRDVTIRGGNLPFNPRLLVLVNGRQVFLDHFGYTDWSLVGVELTEVQQIEVVRGPNSALFGFNAVAGVINIITVDALNNPGISAKVEGGTDDSYSASLAGAFKLADKVGLRVSGGYERTEEWDSITGEIDDPRRYNFSGELTAQVADNVRVTGSYTYSDADALYHGYAYNPLNLENEFQGWNGAVTADTDYGLIKGQVFYNTLEQNIVDLDTPVKNNVLAVKLEDLFKIGTKHTLRVGAEYRHNEMEMDQNQSGQTYYDVYALSGMWEFLATDALTLTVAGRMDQLELGHDASVDPFFTRDVADYDRAYTEFSYNASLGYRIDDLTSVRVGAARGVQVPPLFSLGISLPVGIATVNGNPFLEPSITTSYEISLDRSIPAIEGGFNITASTSKVNGFLAPSQNFDLEVVPPVGLVLVEQALGDFKTYAVEVSLHGREGHFSWQLNYTWTDVDENLTSALVDLEAIVTLDEGTAEHKVNAVLSYENQGWSAFVAGRYRSATVQHAAEFGLDTYIPWDDSITIDARIGYEFEQGFSIWASGENLTDVDAAGLSSFGAERRFLIGLGYKY